MIGSSHIWGSLILGGGIFLAIVVALIWEFIRDSKSHRAHMFDRDHIRDRKARRLSERWENER